VRGKLAEVWPTMPNPQYSRVRSIEAAMEVVLRPGPDRPIYRGDTVSRRLSHARAWVAMAATAGLAVTLLTSGSL
jgi:hypothetical protein